MVLNVSANRITFERFAMNFNRKLIVLIDFTNSTAERNGLYVNYYGYYAIITSLAHVQCNLYYVSLFEIHKLRNIRNPHQNFHSTTPSLQLF